MWISLSEMIPVSKLVPPMSPSRTRLEPMRLASSLAPIAPPAGPEPSRPSGYWRAFSRLMPPPRPWKKASPPPRPASRSFAFSEVR